MHPGHRRNCAGALCVCFGLCRAGRIRSGSGARALPVLPRLRLFQGVWETDPVGCRPPAGGKADHPPGGSRRYRDGDCLRDTRRHADRDPRSPAPRGSRDRRRGRRILRRAGRLPHAPLIPDHGNRPGGYRVCRPRGYGIRRLLFRQARPFQSGV
ncbi:hypothetical protein ASZ90_008922 [hydrocarbon metagenome]|uniref:Uncharacterized protein n=1 Tax=hydrocarbon metagenome TaxID=938273 RepID=A0A0W8FKA9_9ZZZZ